jgi:hypothetical protein
LNAIKAHLSQDQRRPGRFFFIRGAWNAPEAFLSIPPARFAPREAGFSALQLLRIRGLPRDLANTAKRGRFRFHIRAFGERGGLTQGRRNARASQPKAALHD